MPSASDSAPEFDDDNEEEQQYLRPPAIDATKADVEEALKSCQLALGRALAENRTLRQNNGNLLAVQSSKRRGRGSKDTSAFQSAVGPLAKCFFLTQETWVRMQDFKKAAPDPPLTIEQRFANTKNYSLGITAALHAIVPEKLRQYLDTDESTAFARAFMAEHGAARSTLITVIRQAMPTILKKAGHIVDGDLLLAAAADRSTDPILHKLLCFPSDKKLTMFAPLLFPGEIKNMQYLFTSDIVLLTHRVMIHGPSSLAKDIKPDPKANGSKYHIVEASEHSISLAAILARFVLSADKQFAPDSAISKVSWEDDYRTYRQILATNRETPTTQNIFRTFKKIVFAGVSSTTATSTNDADGDDLADDINAAMRALALGHLGEDDQAPDEHSAAPLRGDNEQSVNDQDDQTDEVPSVGPSRPRRNRVRFEDGPPEMQQLDPDSAEEQLEPPVRKRITTRRGWGAKGKQKAT
ncbi:hypothetical protein C8J57DRAFT_1630555 [Mycena rebaudengoi]|nr:hypothetical protein C8J57DRAFT_1630555 [Mycena rebaudengoi]